MLELYQRIRNRRQELNMTQDELAKKLGYKSRSSINKIELGIHDISQSKITDFARALNTTPDYLMGWSEARHADTAETSSADTYVFDRYRMLSETDKATVRHMIERLSLPVAASHVGA